MSYVPVYSEVQEEIVSVTLNLSNCATQKGFALKTNVAEIKKKLMILMWIK